MLFFVLASGWCAAQGPVFHSAHALGGSALDDLGMWTMLSSDGGLISGGYFAGTADFDPGPAVYNLSTPLNRDVFVYKLDSAGNFLWAKMMGGVGNAWLERMDQDAQGNIFLFGTFSGTVDFNPGAATNNLVSAGGNDMFICKLNSTGNFVWARQIGSAGNEGCRGIADGWGNTYLIGGYQGTLDFDPGAGVSNHTSNGLGDIFFIKLNPNGSFLWGHSIGSPGNFEQFGQELCLDAVGNVLMGGYTSGTVDFDPGPGVVSLATASFANAFLAKWNPNGNLIWARKVDGPNEQYLNGIATDLLDNVYLAGVFAGTADFNPGAGVANMTSNGSDDVFVAKWTSNGDYVWAKSFGGTSIDGLDGLASNNSGELFLAGSYRATTDFDPGLGNVSLTVTGTVNGYAAKWDTAGNFIWVGNIASTNSSNGISLVARGTEKLHVTGGFNQTLDVDPDPSSTYNVSSNGLGDVFNLTWIQDTCPAVALVVDSLVDVTCVTQGYAEAHIVGGSGPYLYKWNTVPPTTDSVVSFDTAGVYTLRVTDTLGCVKTTSVIVNSPSLINGWNLNPNIVTGQFRAGTASLVRIDAFNEGCTIVNGDVELVLDTLVYFISSNILPDYIHGDTLGWHYPAMSVDSAHFTRALFLGTHTYATLTDVIDLTLRMTPIVGDADTLDNVKDYHLPVVGAFDPNDKRVYPSGVCDEGYILRDQVLTYTANFQNTGTADAINIDVLDTLSPFLDLNTVRVLGTSHRPLITEVLPGNVLRFRWPDIHLPDSTTDEPGSHGYVLFEVKPKPAAPLGSVIRNSVAIYFDFNAPVLTNTVRNTTTDLLPILNTTVSQNGLTLTANASAASYQWIDCSAPTQPIAGATSQSFTPTSNGSYAVILTNGACTWTSECTFVTVVGLETEMRTWVFKARPNPTHDGQVLLDFQERIPAGIVRVTDVVGHCVGEMAFSEVSGLPLQLPSSAGMYFVTVQRADGGLATLKIIRD